jgi:two-component system LytT family response regulator
MILRAVIVDDEPLARRRLRALLKEEPSIAVVGDAEDGASAVEVIRTLRPDLVFLDVQMPGADGFDVLEAVNRTLGRDAPAVIFVTAYDAYAMQAFDAHAVDYLLKPFDRRRLATAVERAHSLVGGSRAVGGLLKHLAGQRPLQRLLVRHAGRIFFVPVADIDWLSAAGHYVTLHAGGEEHLIRDTLGRLADRLPRGRFARIHRATIVNLDRIRELRPLFNGDVEVVLRNGTRLQASRTYARSLHTD